jgi:hypothetical protein
MTHQPPPSLILPRDHHFIPAFYLKQWCGTDKKLCEFSRPQGKLYAKRVGPDATGYQTDLYAFPELPAEMAQHLERVFFDVIPNDTIPLSSGFLRPGTPRPRSTRQ